MNNRVAELLNVDGKRGIKLPFIKMDLYNIVIGKLLHLYYTNASIYGKNIEYVIKIIKCVWCFLHKVVD